MKFIYATSTYPIFLGLYLKLKGEKIHFLFTRIKYTNLFKLLKVKATFVKMPSYVDYIMKPFKVKKEIDKINKLIGKEDLIFTHLQFAEWLFVILSNRQKGAKSYFYDIEPKARNKILIIDRIMFFKNMILTCFFKIVLKYFYKTHTILSYYTKVFFLSLNKKSFKRNNISEVEIPYSYEEIQTHVMNEFQFDHKLISDIYICQNEILMKGIVFETNSIRKLEKFIETSDIFIKPHPNEYPHFISSKIISPHIPTEFLFNSVRNSIISINSTTLISASNYYGQNSSVKIISLMKLLDFVDKKSESDMIRRLEDRSKNNILYPENYSELKGLIGNTSENDV